MISSIVQTFYQKTEGLKEIEMIKEDLKVMYDEISY